MGTQVWLFRFTLADGTTKQKALDIQRVRVGGAPGRQQRWAEVTPALQQILDCKHRAADVVLISRVTEGHGALSTYQDRFDIVEQRREGERLFLRPLVA